MLKKDRTPPNCLAGFEHVNRYFDNDHNSFAAKILPGEFYVTNNEEVVTTVLGSCISVCVYDPINLIGGMNHFMLPSGNNDSSILSQSFRYGDVAIEKLVNVILRHGGNKNELMFKAFGGGQIIKNMTNIGQRNIAFLQKYMTMAGYPLSASDLGGPYPRKIAFYPLSGKVKLKHLQHIHSDPILARENRYETEISSRGDVTGEIDLFD